LAHEALPAPRPRREDQVHGPEPCGEEAERQSQPQQGLGQAMGTVQPGHGAACGWGPAAQHGRGNRGGVSERAAAKSVAGVGLACAAVPGRQPVCCQTLATCRTTRRCWHPGRK